jgi:hypothetical protein
MLACYVISLIKRAGIATLRQPSCKRHTFPKSSLRLDLKPASFAKFRSRQATRAQPPRCCGGGGVRHTHEVTNNKRLTLPSAVAALKKTTTQFVRHTNATATRVEQP